MHTYIQIQIQIHVCIYIYIYNKVCRDSPPSTFAAICANRMTGRSIDAWRNKMTQEKEHYVSYPWPSLGFEPETSCIRADASAN